MGTTEGVIMQWHIGDSEESFRYSLISAAADAVVERCGFTSVRLVFSRAIKVSAPKRESQRVRVQVVYAWALAWERKSLKYATVARQ